MTVFSSVLIGDESLLVACGDILLDRGHAIVAVVTRDPAIAHWADARAIPVYVAPDELISTTAPFDWLLSLANLRVIPEAVLALPTRGSVNFHDGPLPQMAGLNTPAWARILDHPTHGITWHLIADGIDKGDILEQRLFDIAPDDTAFTLNSKCFSAAMDSFPALIDQLETGLSPRPQDLAQRRYFGPNDRPEGCGMLDLTRPVADLVALVRGLDFGNYANPMTRPRLATPSGTLLVRKAAPATGSGAPGTVLARDADSLTLAAGDGAVRLSGLTTPDGNPATALPRIGAVLAPASPEVAATLLGLASGEGFWRKRLRAASPLLLPLARRGNGTADWQNRAVPLPDLDPETQLAVIAQWACQSAGVDAGDLGFATSALGRLTAAAPDLVAPFVPLRVSTGDLATVRTDIAAQRAQIERHPAFALDLSTRDPEITLRIPEIAVAQTDPVPGSVLTVVSGDPTILHWDANRLCVGAVDLLAARLSHLAGEAAAGRPLDTLCEAEIAVLHARKGTETVLDPSLTVHGAFELQVARTPDATALVVEAETLTYAGLNTRANRMAHTLRAMGVGPGTHVGLCARRSVDLVICALAILKAGGAYVPLDPTYPRDRIDHYVTDSNAAVIVAQPDLIDILPDNGAKVLSTADPRIADADPANPAGGAATEDLAYLIYTSGSTGRPKGVMVEHRNVINFFAGMDARIDHGEGAVWLAVTSLSFDISVLELFWTLARGFKVVLWGDENRALMSGDAPAVSHRKIDFNLFYWGNDGGAGGEKYQLLLEGAKFADEHGFNAVWTPERHFHAFGGAYPNPAVTGAAVAAVTRNLSVRAGSCVAPLHHPARIAEEWAVIDNLTNGRAGLAIASGWQPDDFVLRPENTPPANKLAMFETIETLRRLWRGEAVEFARQDATPLSVVTQPRPVSSELPIWVTTAGNPDTWRKAGSIGANVLTHLLGQSIDEVAGKIEIYHDALRAAGHDPADYTVTLMLHTYLADSRDAAREVAREPMKDYLRSAAGLIKQYVWAFPAFKRPAGATNPFEIDLSGLAKDEMEAILDFAFQRYFDDSGLFGTVDDAVARAAQLKRIGVDEIACLIDYGIAPALVLEGLKPLAEALQRCNAGSTPAENDFSIAAQIQRHGVTHLQCTPSMARMITMTEAARAALGRLKTLMIGGEALPGDLVRDLRTATGARILNMYGPTETTIWSTVHTVGDAAADIQPIGTPIANTQVHVLDSDGRPCPVGVPGELFIGGHGVARGYWGRDDLTAERFPVDPQRGRLYRTDDLVRARLDGSLDFLGRTDHQVKIRGHRIELGEIEARLAEHPAVRQAVVAAREFSGDTRLVAYVIADAAFDLAAMRSHLAVLPDVMVPSHLVHVDRFPLTPNRKIDRNALPDPVARPISVPAALSPTPRGRTGAAIATVWERVLGVTDIRPDDNFFALGGHSLLAVQAHRELRAALDTTPLSITDIFRFPVLSELAAHLDRDLQTDHDTDGGVDVAPARAETMSRRRAMRAERGAKTG